MVFVNDVFFCAGDVVRLLSRKDAHLACGMDFDRPRIAQMDRQVGALESSYILASSHEMHTWWTLVGQYCTDGTTGRALQMQRIAYLAAWQEYT